MRIPRTRAGTHRRRRLRTEPLELELSLPLAADVVISEFVAADDSTLSDEGGDHIDCFEIYNDGPDRVNLAGCYVADHRDNLCKWGFHEETAP